MAQAAMQLFSDSMKDPSTHTRREAGTATSYVAVAGEPPLSVVLFCCPATPLLLPFCTRRAPHFFSRGAFQW